MAELNELTINGSNYTFEDDVARGLATAEANRAQEAEQSLQTAINNKVDKVTGKGLSTNDYTNGEKDKLAGLNNYDDTQVRQLIAQTNANFANYYTKAESYSATEVDTLLRTQRQGQFVVANTLPAPSADTMFKIYLVPSTNPETQNVKDEFVTLENNGTYSWEQIGSTAVDLSGYSTTVEMNAAIANALASYYTKSEIDTALGTKQNIINDLSDIRSGAQAGSTAVQPSTLNSVVKNTVAESGVYDVSANNDNIKFESLSALLSSANLNTLIPTDIRKGGMSIKFVQSSDNKYVQYRLKAQTFQTTPSCWEKEDISEIEDEFKPQNYEAGKRTHTYNEVSDESWGISDYIELGDFTTIVAHFGQVKNSDATIVFYNSGKVALDYKDSTEIDRTINKSAIHNYESIKYCRISFLLAYQDAGVEIDGYYVWKPKGDGIVTEMHRDIEKINMPRDEYQYKNNCYINKNGQLVPNNDWYVAKIDTTSWANKSVTYTVGDGITISSQQKAVCYSSDNTYLEYNSLGNRTVNLHDSTAYILLSVRKSDATKFTVSNNGTIYYSGVCYLLTRISDVEDKASVALDESSALLGRVYTSYFIGAGTVFSSSNKVLLMKGRTYRLVLDNPSFARDNTGTTATQYILEVYSYNGSSYTTLLYVKRSEDTGVLNKYYDFTVPQNSEFINIGGRANTGVEVLFNIYDISDYISPTTIFEKNQDKLDVLRASSNNARRLQLLIATDAHEDWKALQNAVDFANQCSYIDALLLSGDNCGQAVPSLEAFEHYNQIVNTCTKPVLSIPGNHDAGYDRRLRYTATNDKIYQYITQPTIQSLASGEYEAGKSYFFHDFTAKKTRLICLNEFDEDIQLIENSNWQAIEYDASYDSFALNTEYAVNDCVNFGLYTTNSFKCLVAHTSSADNEIRTTEYRGYRFIGETQMNWLVSTMLSTPADYSLVICTHVPASNDFSTMYRNNKFCSKYLSDNTLFNAFDSDVLGKLVDDFNKGLASSILVKGKGTFTYLNTQTIDGQSCAYKLQYDFSQKNTGVKFLVFCCGHTHADMIMKNSLGSYSISPTFTTATTRQYAENDCPRSSDDTNIARDALTAIAFDYDHDGVILTRVGTTSTTDGYLRDVDRLDLTQ